MEILWTNTEYVKNLLQIEDDYDSYYAWGAFGAPANDKNKSRYGVPDAPTRAFLFDCSGFAYKALPWGWRADRNRVYGGATYKRKGFEALETNNILAICSDVSDDFSKILPGEVLYMSGHVGIYVGDGIAIECTSNWSNGILCSEVSNCKIDTGFEFKRTWLKHGKLPFIKYEATSVSIPQADEPVYTEARMGEGLIRIARRCGISLAEIKTLNPGIKGPAYIVRYGQKVRIK